jgi:WD40 repeat protein
VDGYRTVALSPDEETLFTGPTRIREKKPIYECFDAKSGKPTGEEFDVAKLGDPKYKFHFDSRQLLDVATNTPVKKIVGHAGRYIVVTSPDNMTCVSVSSGDGGDGTMKVWDINEDGPPKKVIETGLSMAPAFSQDGRLFAIESWSKGEIQIFDTTNWKQRLTVPGGAYRSMTFSPDGTHLAGSGAGEYVTVMRLDFSD